MKHIHVVTILCSFYSLALCAADPAAQSQHDSAVHLHTVVSALEVSMAQSQRDGGTGYKQAHELAQARDRAAQSQSDKQRYYSSHSGGKSGGGKSGGGRKR